MPLYDFRCSTGHTTEAIRPSDVCSIACPCGQTARRLISSRVAIVGPTTDTRGMYRRFTEASAEITHAAERHEQNTGQPAQQPNLWQAAKQKAHAMVAAGEAPPARGRTIQ